MFDDTEFVVDVEQVKAPIGRAMLAYFQESVFYAESSAMVKSFLYGSHIIPAVDKKCTKNLRFIPGSTLGGRPGPRRGITVMLVGRIAQGVGLPQRAANGDRQMHFEEMFKPIDYLLGDTYDVLAASFSELGLPETTWRNFYVTNMVRFPRPTLTDKGAILKSWVKEGEHLLEQELRIIRPDFIFCMGTEASTYFTGYTITKAQSHVFDYTLPCGKPAKVVCSIDPLTVIQNFEKRPQFMASLKLFVNAVLGKEIKARNTDHRIIDDADTLQQLVDELINRGVDTFAIDCEWGGGQHYLDRGAALRTVQIGWSGSSAAVVVLRHEGMNNAFVPYISDGLALVRKLLCRPGVRVVGHNILADLPWLYDLGIDLMPYVYFDTMLAAHLFEPTASHGLEDLAVKLLPGWPRHDIALSEWKKEVGFGDGGGNAYGDVPGDVLYPYGAYDVCATLLLYRHYYDALLMPENKGLRDLFFRIIMPALPAFNEMQCTGVTMDVERLDSIRYVYRQRYEDLLAQFRTIIGNPTFNPNSSDQKSKLLFGKLGLTPIKATGKYPMMWDTVMERGEEAKHSPASDGESLDILAHRSPEARMLRNICLLGTVLQNFLPDPKLDMRSGYSVITSGLAAVKCTGRLYTSIGQMVKTGRLSSSNPNLMNLPNKQEAPIEKILGSDIYKLRACFTAPPGELLIISDYIQAEIAALAYLSGDDTLIAAVEAGDDIHSVVGRKMFEKGHLTSKEFKSKFKQLRIAAKSIVFGLLYGRGPIAIAREVEKAGVDCSVDDATKFVSDFMEQFPKVADLIENTHRQVVDRGWVENLWGRREYFYTVGIKDNSKIEARQKRMGFNFLIQGYVAELLRVALINLCKYRLDNPGVRYKVVLTVHDSIVLQAPAKYVEHVSEVVVPECMTRRARAPRLGFTVNTDTDVCLRWDEKLSLADFLELGLSKEYALKYCKKEQTE